MSQDEAEADASLFILADSSVTGVRLSVPLLKMFAPHKKLKKVRGTLFLYESKEIADLTLS